MQNVVIIKPQDLHTPHCNGVYPILPAPPTADISGNTVFHTHCLPTEALGRVPYGDRQPLISTLVGTVVISPLNDKISCAYRAFRGTE